MKPYLLNLQHFMWHRHQWKPIILTGILSLASATASAAEFYVDAGVGNNANACDATSPCQSIKEVYDRAVSGDDIYLVGGTPFEVGRFEISKDLTFHGEGKDRTTLHPKGVGRHFLIQGDLLPLPPSRVTVRFEDMTLEGGFRQGDCGGSILVAYGNLEVERVAFLNNQADCGGAVSVANGTLLSIDSEYRANRALVSNGGAIDCLGILNGLCSGLEILDSEFTANIAQERGGALYTEAPAEIRRSDFYANLAEIQGGAIYSSFVNEGVFLIRKSQFTGNEADHDGGAIYVVSGGADIRSSAFVDNCYVPFYFRGIASTYSARNKQAYFTL